jgi:copper chaperone CopZ
MRRATWMLAMVVGVVLVGASCRKTDVRTAVIRVPQMRTQDGAKLVTEAIKQARYGVQVDSIKADVVSRTVTLKYDSMELAIKNIEFLVADAGFDANEVPRNTAAAAKLPAECR